MRFVLIILLCALFVSACDNGLAPPPPDLRATITGRISYIGRFPSCDSVISLAVVLARPPAPYTDSQLINGLNTEFYPISLDKCTFRDTTFRFTIDPGTYHYLGVAHNYKDLFKDWQVVGFVHDENDSAKSFILKAGDEISGVNIRVRFDSLPRQPFIQ